MRLHGQFGYRPDCQGGFHVTFLDEHLPFTTAQYGEEQGEPGEPSDPSLLLHHGRPRHLIPDRAAVEAGRVGYLATGIDQSTAQNLRGLPGDSPRIGKI